MVSLTYVTLIFTVFMAATAMANDEVDPTAATEELDIISDADFDAIVLNETLKYDTKGICKPDCSFGWKRLKSRCYIYQRSSMDWASAENQCLKLGAHLVSIHSHEEQKFVKALIRAHDKHQNPTWIGLSGCQQKNEFFWSDGTGLTFTKWSPFQPNFRHHECCVVINWASMKNWNDLPCGEKKPFVCAKRISSLLSQS